MKKISALIFLVLLLGLVPSWSANTPKAGSSCSKKGATQIYQNKKFTCVSSGKKLIWDKGLIIKQILPTTTTTSTIPIISTDPITSNIPTSTAPPVSTSTPINSDSNSADNLSGQTCTSENQIIRNSVGEFWCLKDGNAILRWSKNNVSNSSSGQNSNNKTISHPNDSKIDQDCKESEFDQKLEFSGGILTCKWQGAYTFKWSKIYVAPTNSNSKANNYTSIPGAGNNCDLSGDTYDISNGYLECRYVSGGNLRWMYINSVKDRFINIKSPAGVDVCKLKNSDVDVSSLPTNTRGGVRDLGQVPGFPAIPRNGFINPGTNKALVVGMDFPELRGNDAELKAINDYDKKILNQWFSYFSNGLVKFDLTSIDYWLHAPKNAKKYSTSGTFDSTAENGNSGNDGITQEMIDIITKEIDLTPFATVFLIFPNGELTLDTDWIVRNRPFKTKEGIRNLNFFGWGRDNELMKTERWAYYIHEVMHDAPLIGHAPGNGWPFGIMTQQSGISYSLPAWELFQIGWLPDNQIYCIDSTSLSKSTVSLTPLEREDNQTKTAIIKLSKTKALVIESHGIEKWSSFNSGARSFPAGFYGVMAYTVDLQNSVAPPVQSDGRAIQDDTGNDPRFPRWAYFKKIDGDESFKSYFSFTSGEKYNSYIATLGDTFTIEGIKIKLVGAGDYETIEITKA